MSRKRIIGWWLAAALAVGVGGMSSMASAEDVHAAPATTQVEKAAGETGGVAVEAHTQASGQAVEGHVDQSKQAVAGAHNDNGGHQAAHSEHPDPAKKLTEWNPLPLVFTILVFLLLVAILRVTAWKPILAGLKSREESIRNSIEAAAKAKADAERTTRELEARMAEAQRQGALQLQQAKADALKLAESIKAQAEADSTALKDRTLRDIDAAKQQALSEINAHAADLGVAVARKILQREVKVDDQARLVEESLAQLGTTKV